VLCSGSGRVLRSGSLRCGSALLPGSRLWPGVLRSGCVCRSSVLRSSEVLRSGSGVCAGLLCSGCSLLRSAEVLPGSGLVLCSGLCAEVLCSGSGELLCSGRSGLQHLQYVQQLQ
jgi:hypothetical protein